MIFHLVPLLTPPALLPRVVGLGVVSTRFDSVAYTGAPDGTVVFVRRCPGTLLSKTVLCETKRHGSRWEKPHVLPFSGLADDLSPQFSPDGTRLYFSSNRGHSRYFAIWSVGRAAKVWSTPQKLTIPSSATGHQFSISQAASGSLYLCSTRKGQGELFEVPKTPAGFSELKPIDAINQAGYIYDACVSPDESFLVFSALGGPDELISPGAVYNRGDLYVSLKRNGEWQKPVHLPKPANTVAGETEPTLSPDGRTLYFASDRGFMTRRRTHPLTYSELRRKWRTTDNGMSKIYSLPVTAVLAVADASNRVR